jgi:hypothetical protein
MLLARTLMVGTSAILLPAAARWVISLIVVAARACVVLRPKVLLVPSLYVLYAHVTGLVAVLAVVGVMAFNARTAHGSGTGGGGCFNTSGPACTFKGNSSFNDFGTVSSDGCIFTDAQVSFFDSLTRPGNVATQSVFVSISKWDSCNGIQLEYASNFDPNSGASTFNGTVQFGANLSSDTVNGTAPMYDGNTGNLVFTTTINLIAKGYGSTSKFSDSSHFHAPGFVMNAHFTGTSRSSATSGTFTDDAGNNIAATPSLSSELENSIGGTVQIFRQ